MAVALSCSLSPAQLPGTSSQRQLQMHLLSPLVLESGLRVLHMLYFEAMCHSVLGCFWFCLTFLYGACIQTPVWTWRWEGSLGGALLA